MASFIRGCFERNTRFRSSGCVLAAISEAVLEGEYEISAFD